MRITRKHGECSDGTCPAVYDTDDPEMVGVQGAILTDAQALGDIGEIPAHESVVLLPRSLFESYVRGRP
jgi:hypothetical protein